MSGQRTGRPEPAGKGSLTGFPSPPFGERRVSPRFCHDDLFIYLLLFRFSNLCYRVSCLLLALVRSRPGFLLAMYVLIVWDLFF